VNRQDERRRLALRQLQELGVLMHAGHYDYGNGYHGRAYLNPHQLFLHPSTIWRLAQDLLDMLPGELIERTEVVAGPVTGGALLAHTMAGLLDGRRALTHPQSSFAPFQRGQSQRSAGLRPETVGASTATGSEFILREFYARHVEGKRVLLADDVRNTGVTFQRCAELVTRAGGEVIATVEICDRLEAVVDLGIPNYALAEYQAPENHPAADCPMCRAGEAITTF
jgi:orotate phosphoribosyltransferase